MDGEEDINEGLDLFELSEVLVQLGAWHAIVSLFSGTRDKSTDTVKPALVTTCIQRPPLFKDHLVMSQLWLYHAFLPLLKDHLYSKTTFFCPKHG